jgi:RNA polymerase sigma factor (sigma-70 family)
VKWNRIRSYPEAWITRVATNLALDLVRRKRPDPLLPASLGREDELVTRLALAAALRGLPARQREVLVLRFLVGLSEREVAETLRVGAASVKTHQQRGLATLRSRSGIDPEEVRLVSPDPA